MTDKPLVFNYADYIKEVKRRKAVEKELAEKERIVAYLSIVLAFVVLVVFIAGIVLIGRAGSKIDAIVSDPVIETRDDDLIAGYLAWEAEQPHDLEYFEILALASVERESSFYPMSETERDEIERVVMAEMGGTDADGLRLLASCILNGCIEEGVRPCELIAKYRYTTARVNPSDECKKAVRDVFDDGDFVPAVRYMYQPKIVQSAWHENQVFMVEHSSGVRFFS